MTNIFKLPVHPSAAIFPLMDEDELDQLAADIKTNGLIHPLVVKDGQLIDGRNRREACKRAGIEPTTVDLNGADPDAYILSANINRRHMTKGQRAMATAMMFPEGGGKGGRGKKDSAGNPSEIDGFSRTLIKYARLVLQWAPELSKPVLSGATPLDEAYETATDRRNKAEGPALRLEALRAIDPDLAERVVEEKIGISEAETLAAERRQKERVQRQGIYDGLGFLEQFAFLFTEPNHRAAVLETIAQHPKEFSRKRLTDLVTKLEQAIAQLKKEW